MTTTSMIDDSSNASEAVESLLMLGMGDYWSRTECSSSSTLVSSSTSMSASGSSSVSSSMSTELFGRFPLYFFPKNFIGSDQIAPIDLKRQHQKLSSFPTHTNSHSLHESLVKEFSLSLSLSFTTSLCTSISCKRTHYLSLTFLTQ